MGLDVLMYHCNDRPAAKALEEKYEQAIEPLWAEICDPHGNWKNLAQVEKDARYKRYEAEKKRVALEMGLDDDGGFPGVKKIEQKSDKYPEHYFKIGYFRSSYNSGGINSVLSRYGLPDLGYIMDGDGEYEFAPDWKASRERAADVLNRLRAVEHGDIDILTVSPNPFNPPDEFPGSIEAARQIVVQALKQERGEGALKSFSNSHGEFFLDGLQVIAMLPGREDSFTKTLYGHAMPCTYVAYRRPTADRDWYTQALEIVIETCDYVLAKADPQNYYLHWSS